VSFIEIKRIVREDGLITGKNEDFCLKQIKFDVNRCLMYSKDILNKK
jgi:hypothetical protein